VKIAFIGMGNMGEAIISAVLRQGVAAPGEITGSDIKPERREYISQQYGVKAYSTATEAISGADLVVVACKPQDVATTTGEFAGQLTPDQVAISILAGTRIQTLQECLKHDRIVRVMPNTPAQVGQGMSVWTATPAVSDAQKAAVSQMLAAMGKEVYADDESYLDMATAISGSGPAYVFLFVEALEAAAVRIGFNEETARQLALQTTLGAALYLEQSGKPAAELRRMVTSPGGTTAEAIAKFEAGGFTELVYQAVLAAHQRAQTLGS
jgi:pyrroline-5-carboxylate reductase